MKTQNKKRIRTLTTDTYYPLFIFSSNFFYNGSSLFIIDHNHNHNFSKKKMKNSAHDHCYLGLSYDKLIIVIQCKVIK